MAERDPSDSLTREKDSGFLAGKENLAGTPGVAAAEKNHGALTYPRVDVTADAPRGVPHGIREFKAYPDASDDREHQIPVTGPHAPNDSGLSPLERPQRWRQATEKKAVGFKMVKQASESPLLGLNCNLLDQCKIRKDLDDDIGYRRESLGPSEE